MLALPFGDYRGTEQLCCDVISGGLNGGAVAVLTTIAVLCAGFASIVGVAMLIWTLVQVLATILTPVIFVVGVLVLAAILVTIIEMNRRMLLDYMDYMFTGNLDSAISASERAVVLGDTSLMMMDLVCWLNKFLNVPLNDGSSSGSGGGDTDDGNTSGNKGDTDDGSASGNKGDTDDGSTSGNKGDTDDGSTSGNKGDVDDGTSGGTTSDGGDSTTGGGSQASGETSYVYHGWSISDKIPI